VVRQLESPVTAGNVNLIASAYANAGERGAQIARGALLRRRVGKINPEAFFE
jgi:hypothetical protein